jgi:hypothetical protein
MHCAVFMLRNFLSVARSSTYPDYKKVLAMRFTLISTTFLSACHGRPTFDIRVLEFQSDCQGAAAVRFEHDPDPDTKSVRVEPGFEEMAKNAQMHFTDDGMRVVVEFNADSICYHPTGGVVGTCFSKVDNTPLGCNARFKRLAYRWPSKGQGSEPPLGKIGEDTPVPADHS